MIAVHPDFIPVVKQVEIFAIRDSLPFIVR
jgi:hypothetical protein